MFEIVFYDGAKVIFTKYSFTKFKYRISFYKKDGQEAGFFRLKGEELTEILKGLVMLKVQNESDRT